MATFGLWIEELPGLHVVHLYGELDMAEAARLKSLLVNVGRSTVSVNLSKLTFLDAQGLDAIVSARQTILAEGNTFRIVGARGIVRRVFELTGLVSLLDS